jgi:hypothetical protein
VELSLNIPERRRGRGRSRKYSKKGFKDDVTPTTYLSRKSFEGLTNSTHVKKPLKKRALPFDEEEDDTSAFGGPLYVSIDDRRGVGNKSEFSGSRSRSGRRRYRSKSEDVYEKRKQDEESE